MIQKFPSFIFPTRGRAKQTDKNLKNERHLLLGLYLLSYHPVYSRQNTISNYWSGTSYIRQTKISYQLTYFWGFIYVPDRNTQFNWRRLGTLYMCQTKNTQFNWGNFVTLYICPKKIRYSIDVILGYRYAKNTPFSWRNFGTIYICQKYAIQLT